MIIMDKEYIKLKSEEIQISEEAFVQIMDNAIKEVEEALLKVKTLIEKNDFNSLKEVIHQVKGVFLNFRIDELTGLVKEIENLVAFCLYQNFRF